MATILRSGIFFLQLLLVGFPLYAQQLLPNPATAVSLLKTQKEGLLNLHLPSEKLTTLRSWFPDIPWDSGTPIDPKIRETLWSKLSTDGFLKIPFDSLSILTHLDIPTNEPKTLANLLFSIKRLGGVKSLSYDVKKGDTIRFAYSIQKGAGADELEVLEGKEIRYSFSKTPKKKNLTGDLIIGADGEVTFTLTNRGLFRSQGTLQITSSPAIPPLSFRYGCDTIQHVRTDITTITDTLYEPLASQQFSIPPRIDITKPAQLEIPITIVPGKKWLAIGIWIGSDPGTKRQWQALVEKETDAAPLGTYLRQEVLRRSFSPLPEETGKELLFSIRDNIGWELRNKQGNYLKTSYAVPSLNHRRNYVCFILNPDQALPDRLFILFENVSTLYQKETDLRVEALVTDTHEEEKESILSSCKEYVTIKIL